MANAPALYLAYEATGEVAEGAPGPWDDLVVLRPGLLLVDSDAGRSRVYHALKRLLPAETPLLVAPLADAPKMAHMAPGTTAWVRAREASVGG